MSTRIVFSNKLLASHRATSVFADFGSVRVLIGRRWRVSPWIVLTLGEDGFAVIREGQDLWSLLDMPKFLNAATAPSWVWWDDQLNPEQFEEALGPETTRDRESFGRALGHDGPWKILQWKCFASIRCCFLAFQWKYARIQSSKKLLVMPGCSLGSCSLRGPFPDPFLSEGATDQSPKSEPIFFDFRKWGSPKKASQRQGGRSGNSRKESTGRWPLISSGFADLPKAVRYVCNIMESSRQKKGVPKNRYSVVVLL